jgi:long-chain acyl-CoA synthetase
MTAPPAPAAPAPDPERPWVATYPPGVPAEADVAAYPSLVALLDDAWKRHARREAAAFMGRSFTFAQIDERSRALGAWLQAQGIGRGDRVALMMPNVPQYLVAIGAVLRAGAAVVNVNPLYTPRELKHQLADSGATAIVVLENFAHTLEAVIGETAVKHVVLASIGDMLGFAKGQLVNFMVRHVKKLVPEFRLPLGSGRTVTRFNMAVAEGTRAPLRPVSLGPDDVAFLQYTGGTTGVSKGATLLHRNVVANVMQCDAWFRPVLSRLEERQMTMVCALPLYHIYALTICFMMGSRFGALNVLVANPRDIAGFVRILRGFRVNFFPAVNTLFNALADEPAFTSLDFSHLLVSSGGGMAVQRSTAERWEKITGCPIVEGYGLSETSPVATSNHPDIGIVLGTIGVPIPSTDVAIRDDAGADLPMGEAGEICIRGPQVMAGYWKRPDETAKVMTADGFFRSGDIGVMDERGFLKIVDRKKDMILVSGFNVYPNEIEEVVSRHPGVFECAAVGVPDERSGEAVKLFVVRRDAALAEEDIAAWCRENFTAYKRPKWIEFRDELPKSNVGKILRRELRTPAA